MKFVDGMDLYDINYLCRFKSFFLLVIAVSEYTIEDEKGNVTIITEDNFNDFFNLEMERIGMPYFREYTKEGEYYLPRFYEWDHIKELWRVFTSRVTYFLTDDCKSYFMYGDNFDKYFDLFRKTIEVGCEKNNIFIFEGKIVGKWYLVNESIDHSKSNITKLEFEFMSNLINGERCTRKYFVETEPASVPYFELFYGKFGGLGGGKIEFVGKLINDHRIRIIHLTNSKQDAYRLLERDRSRGR